MQSIYSIFVQKYTVFVYSAYLPKIIHLLSLSIVNKSCKFRPTYSDLLVSQQI